MHVRRQARVHQEKNVAWLKRVVFMCNAVVNDVLREQGISAITHALVLNRFQAASLREHFGIAARRMISGHPIPTAVTSLQERLKHPVILWTGNLGTNKRPEMFVKLAVELADQPLRFVLVGGHPDQHRINAVIGTIPDNLEWTGRVSFEESLAWFDKTAIFVNTSRKEGFPNTFIQAWMRGIPTVSLGVDPDDVIHKNALGCVVSDIDEMKERITALLKDENRYARVSQRARDYAIKNHSISLMTDEFVNSLQKSKQRAK
jgi:glycosyltransferase involved in cell wall biosynthesis